MAGNVLAGHFKLLGMWVLGGSRSWLSPFLVTILLCLIFVLTFALVITTRQNRQQIVRLKNQIRKLRQTVKELNERRPWQPDSLKPSDPPSQPPGGITFVDYYTSTTFRLSKSDENIEACADAAQADLNSQTFVIADGVSQAFNSAKWSQLLANTACRSQSVETILNSATGLAADWSADCEEQLTSEDAHSFLRIKQSQGSQSTLAIFFQFEREGRNFWRFYTVGDSLLVVLHNNDTERRISRFLPFTRSEDFPSSPDTLSTQFPYLRGRVQMFELAANSADSYILMTDALARYLIKNSSVDSDILSVFPFLSGIHADFENWVDQHRVNGLDDDDCTLIDIFPHE